MTARIHPTLIYPVVDCREQVAHTDKDVTIAPLNTHSNTHTVGAGSIGSSCKKRGKWAELKTKKGMSTDSGKSSQVLWRLYKTGADLSEAKCSLQLMYSCSEEHKEQLIRKYPNITVKPEIKRSLTIVPGVIGAGRFKLLSTSQEVDGWSKIPSKTEQIEKCRQRPLRGHQVAAASAKVPKCHSVKVPPGHRQDTVKKPRPGVQKGTAVGKKNLLVSSRRLVF